MTPLYPRALGCCWYREYVFDTESVVLYAEVEPA
jgi:hypothetical protein